MQDTHLYNYTIQLCICCVKCENTEREKAREKERVF